LQRVNSYEYELPDDFEDEEIDEDEAFNSEDERLYGHIFENREPLSGSEV
jgi:U3 small nucleolar RNA-associated protein 14